MTATEPSSSEPSAPRASPDGGPPPEVIAALGGSRVRLEYHGRRADVVLDSPADRNAQTAATWRALAAVGGWLPSVADVVVLRATGPSFSSGLDRRALTPQGPPEGPVLAELAAMTPAERDAAIAGYQEGFSCWSADGFLTVAAVQGHAIGAGFQLALACDLRLAADDARFALRETSLGLVPDLGGTHPLVRQVGFARALDLCATGRAVDAVEAERLGLVQRVVPVAELGAAVDALVGTLLAVPRAALLATKTLLRDADGRSPREQRAAERAAQAELLPRLAGGPAPA